ncbi:MAG: glycosyltransferase, partial [Candidatus Magasanikbacteria bacterium]|nr:glycosyltransferase [Candidatus Magasanikbacteria bacterium]
VVVGRISPVKDYETLIRAVALVIESGKISRKIRVTVVGGAGLPEQEKYLEDLKLLVADLKLDDVVDFVGPRANTEILSFLQSADLFVNTSLTGSLDKAMLEAMACGVPVLTCNEAMEEVLGKEASNFMFEKKDFHGLAGKITELLNLNNIDQTFIGQSLRQNVIKNHNIAGLITKIITTFNL